LSEYGENVFVDSFTGPFTDYTPAWYNDVGYKTLQTMIINMMMPFANYCSTYMVPAVMQWLDSGGNLYETKLTSMKAFRSTYGG
jgi:hypothetical protein